MKKKKKELRGIKPYKKLTFSDDFMFGHVMQDRKLCHDVLECLLGRKVGKLREITAQREFRYTKDGKPMRLDLYTRDKKTVYDSEIQNLNNKSIDSLALPKRTRFYQSSMDTDHMEKNASYESLPDSSILFLCTFDPYSKGFAKYTFSERCNEDTEICLNDGTEKIFYNCTYKGYDIPDDLRSLYDYIESGKAESNLTKRIDEAIVRARKREEWRSEYMKEMVLLMDARKEGMEKGIKKERRNTEKERKNAEREKKNAEREKRNAELERERADRAEKRVKELEAILAGQAT